MTLLREWLRSSAIVPGHYDESFPSGGGGSSAQVFEVTDLLIPAGTDWSVSGHVIGTFDADALGAFVCGGGFELAEGPGADAVAMDLWTPDVGSEQLVAQITGTDTVGMVPANLVAQSVPFDFYTSGALPDSYTVSVRIITGGPTAAPITIVRARAAFLLI